MVTGRDITDTQMNPGIDREVLERITQFNAELRKFGIDPLPAYGLAPALGGTLVGKPPQPSTIARTQPFDPPLPNAAE